MLCSVVAHFINKSSEVFIIIYILFVSTQIFSGLMNAYIKCTVSVRALKYTFWCQCVLFYVSLTLLYAVYFHPRMKCEILLEGDSFDSKKIHYKRKLLGCSLVQNLEIHLEVCWREYRFYLFYVIMYF
jgi:hypothetical protein